MRRGQVDPLVEYYRGRLAPAAAPGEPIALPGVGGGWRRYEGKGGLGGYPAGYQQDGTGYVLPAGVVEESLRLHGLRATWSHLFEVRPAAAPETAATLLARLAELRRLITPGPT